MIQEIAPHKFRNEYRPVPPKSQDFMLIYEGRKVLVRKESAEIVFPTFQDLEQCNLSETLYQKYTYLFEIDEIHFYRGESRSLNLPEEYEWADVQLFRTGSPKYLAFAAVTGWQMNRWYETHQFCGRCGKLMIHDSKERMMRCTECGLMEFPKICPAVIVGLTHGNKILMTKYARGEHKRYALVAGYAETGETIEEAVAREVMEEVGLKVKNLRYYKSQPWSYSDSLLFGFFCELDGDDETVTLDQNELAVAEWFEREEMPVEANDISLTNEMMMAFKNRLV
jgi:NAD+ diphosphatase